ncbi:NAD(P)-dependent alcohol dehydrogenase [Paraconexibacter antarcticus]|uniref:NAD(P)-dependent alcohol dehydrogenase n=1 Tax=Paraconexibacter antarcticus TaxID=2949664 RepID=A0ABY5DMA1_9ACTN|nr:NAD(P)-dependent alcohol dehydrogenase [Paraconexibacter antarcticus]UTI62659.1 NAD(P)-dependent alcohol dehydrogenase [Paraconexibacter antarcticus]
MKITAAVVRETGAPFQLEELELDAPQAGEVLVAIRAVGVCHTDIAIQKQWLPVPLPLVLGHEGAGIVEAVGDGVTKVRAGDKVALSFGSCGGCPTCSAGRPAYCFEFSARNVSGGRPDGTNALHDVNGNFFSQSSFATHAIATERNTVKLPDDADLTLVGPLGCGIQTGAGTVLNRLKPAAGQTIAIFGVGAVGLSAVMGAKVAGCGTIIAVDLVDARLDLAKELGATHVVNAGQVDDVVAEIMGITQVGVDFSVETTAVERVAEQAVSCLTFLGTAAMLGLGPAGTRVNVDMTELLIPGRTITGVVEGDSDPDVFIPQLVALHAEGKFPYDRLITTYPFADINRAVEDVESGAATKAVLVLG